MSKFLKQILKQDNNWASKLVAILVKEIGINPLLVEIEINNIIAPQIYAYLKENKDLSLSLLATSLHNKEQQNIFLSKRGDDGGCPVIASTAQQAVEMYMDTYYVGAGEIIKISDGEVVYEFVVAMKQSGNRIVNVPIETNTIKYEGRL